jgi:2-desacetyl-2-hydroxyethyl bacteriochlorophyllide A dehydrogenase
MVLRAPREIVAGDVPRPQVDSNQVVVRVTHSGICGTDYKIYSGAIPVSYPRVMGHEMTGHVVDAGGMSALREGERVIVDPQLFCGACFHCRIGQTHLCPRGILIGRDVNGGFAELVAAPSSHVFSLPDSISGQTAPLIQVLTTCLHAQQQIKIKRGESAVVYGLGVTGQLHVQLARAAGATPVIGITRSSDKRSLAETLGADLTMAGDDAAIERVAEATGGRGADVVIETTGMLPSVASAVRMARPGGRVLLFGIITAKEGALPFYDLYFKELSLVGARVARSEDYPAAIALVEKGDVKLAPLVSNVLPLADLDAAVTMLGSDNGARMKVILEHGGVL